MGVKERPILFSAPMVRSILGGWKTQTRRIIKPKLNSEGDFLHAGNIALAHRHINEWRQQEGRWFGLAGWNTLAWSDCPYGQTNERLWVREAWSTHGFWDHLSPKKLPAKSIHYWADGECKTGKKRPSIHMPRWASRITLEITDVRVERLQEINEKDALAEGCRPAPFPGPWWQGYRRDEDGFLDHQQTIGESPPDWMIDPYPMRPINHLDKSAVHEYRTLWESINGPGSWEANPWVWVIEFRRIGA